MRLSVSQIKAYKSCKQMWRLRYLEHLEPVQKAEALETGSTYHAFVEALEKGEPLPDVFTKERAMAEAFKKYILPQLPKKLEPEKWLETDIGDGFTFVGIADGISDDWLVEHKSTGASIEEDYEYGLQWDEQILAYMWMTGLRKCLYTICRKPTIRQKKDETEEEFYQRMVEWYDTDTESKIRLLKLFRTDSDIETFVNGLMYLKTEIRASKKLSEQYGDVVYTRNTNHCTKWGRRCEYSSVCLDYQPDSEYIEFIRKD